MNSIIKKSEWGWTAEVFCNEEYRSVNSDGDIADGFAAHATKNKAVIALDYWKIKQLPDTLGE